MKKLSGLALSALILISTSAISQDYTEVTYGIPLESLDQTKKALTSGAVVTASIDLTKCTLATGQESTNSSGGLKIDSFLIERDGDLRFSSFRTTLSSRSDAAVTQNNKYVVSEDGSATLTSSVFSLPDYTLISKVDVYCKLNESFFFYSAY